MTEPRIIMRHIEISIPTEEYKPITPTEAIAIVIDDLTTDIKSDLFDKAMETISFEGLQDAWIAASNRNVRVSKFAESFRSEWTTRSHRSREVFDNDNLLASVLWRVLPPYIGDDLVIWRGEQTSRFKFGILGFNWSSNRDSADLFAGGLCASYPGGGTLLRAWVAAEGVISGYGNHSIDPEENGVVVDPKYIKHVESVVTYPEYKS